MDSLSFSNTISKQTVMENTSMTYASLEDAKKRENDAISNERIQNGDMILETYEVTSDAISGGMGSVWRVHHQSWNTDLAMKRPQPRFFAEGSEGRKEQFIKECENWINLGLHPNIVSCYYVREIGGVPTIFSEWMDGGSLKDRIADGSLYEGTEQEVQERILDIAIQATRGLQYSHENGLIHQDMKPGNLLLSKTWDAKVADFGLAKAKEQLDDKSEVAKTTGYTLAYCPKEQSDKEEPARWMDIYAWALTVLEMYAGKRLWNTGVEAKDHIDKYWQRCEYAVPDKMQMILNTCLTEKPDGLSDIVTSLLNVYLESTEYEYFRFEPDVAANTADYLNNKALSFVDLKQPEKAKVMWEDGLAMMPSHAEIVYNYGLYLWRSGLIDDVELVFRIKGASTEDEKTKERIKKVNAERGCLHHFAENYFDLESKYGIDKTKDIQWIQDNSEMMPTENVSCVYLDNHTNRLAVGSSSGKLVIYDPDTKREIKTFVGHKEEIKSVYLHIDLLFSSSRDEIKVWDVKDARCLCSVSSELYMYDFGRIWYDETDGLVYVQVDENEGLDEVHSFIFRPGNDKADYELSKIQSSAERLTKDRQYNANCRQAERLMSLGIYADALQKLQEARQIDGYANNEKLLDLNEAIGKHCKRVGFREVYQRFSVELPEEEYLSADFSRAGNLIHVSKKDSSDYGWYDAKNGKLIPNAKEEGISSTAPALIDHEYVIRVFGLRVILVNTASGRIIWQGDVDGSRKCGSRLTDVQLITDNRILVCQEYSLIFVEDGIEKHNNLFVIDIKTGNEKPVQNVNNVLRMAVIPDKSYGVIVDNECDVMLFSVKDFQFSEKMQLMPKITHNLYEAHGEVFVGKIVDLKFSSDGRFLLISGVYPDTCKAVVKVFEIDWIYE